MAKRKGGLSEIGADRLKKVSMALDDLVWTLQGLKLEEVKKTANLLRTTLHQSDLFTAVTRSYQSSDPNKQFLIGVLPRLFQDKQLFPQNEDIVDFAASALKLELNRSEKRSRYEIIGKVVCETDQLDEQELSSLVAALGNLVGDKEKLAQMAARKKSGSFSWNETIQELLKS